MWTAQILFDKGMLVETAGNHAQQGTNCLASWDHLGVSVHDQRGTQKVCGKMKRQWRRPRNLRSNHHCFIWNRLINNVRRLTEIWTEGFSQRRQWFSFTSNQIGQEKRWELSCLICFLSTVRPCPYLEMSCGPTEARLILIVKHELDYLISTVSEGYYLVASSLIGSWNNTLVSNTRGTIKPLT